MKIASVVIFTAMAICIKASAPHVPPGEAVFFRSLFAIPVIVAWLAWRGSLQHGLRTDFPLGHVWRGMVGTAAMGLGFTALMLLPLPEATALGYAMPILTVMFGAMFLGEQVRLFRLGAVGVGLAGVLVVLSPRMTVGADASGWETVGTMAALTGAVCAALAQVFVRRLIQTEATAAIVFWFSVTATVLSLATLPFGWVVPAPREAALLVGAGILGGLGQVLLTGCYRHAEAGVVAPFEYVSMLLAIAVGYLVFGEVPVRATLIGAALIVAAGLVIIWRERQLAIAREPAA